MSDGSPPQLSPAPGSEPPPRQPERREFLKKALAVTVGGAALLPPVVAGLATVIDPLRRPSISGGFLHVTNLQALPADGVPRRFAVIADRADIWNRFPSVPIGAVYLRRTPEGRVEALNVICPHAGCPVEYRSSTKLFLCPCHDSSFDLDGAIANPRSPTPRALDRLEVEIRRQNEIWVKFQNFRAATPARVPV